MIEIVILFDLLVVVACFGVLVRYLVAHVGSTSKPRPQTIGGLTMTGTLLLITMLAPLVAAAGCLLTRAARVAESLNLARQP